MRKYHGSAVVWIAALGILGTACFTPNEPPSYYVGGSTSTGGGQGGASSTSTGGGTGGAGQGGAGCDLPVSLDGPVPLLRYDMDEPFESITAIDSGSAELQLYVTPPNVGRGSFDVNHTGFRWNLVGDEGIVYDTSPDLGLPDQSALTLEIVAKIDSAIQDSDGNMGGSVLFYIGNATLGATDGLLSLSVHDDGSSRVFALKGRAETDADLEFGRWEYLRTDVQDLLVIHATLEIIGSTATATFHVNGMKHVDDGVTQVTAGESVPLGNANVCALGNLPAEELNKSFEGWMTYAALYGEVLSGAVIAHNATRLACGDDFAPT